MSVEISFMVGPALGVLVATNVSTVAAVISLGVLLVLAGAAVYLVNPPVRGAHDEPESDAPRPARRQWLRSRMLATLVLAAGTVFVLAGVEVSMVAALRGVGQVGWTGVVTIGMCVASLIGGLIYGAMHRTPSALVLLGGLGGLAIPAGLAGGQWWALCLALVPSSILCAPTLAAGSDLVSRLAPASVRGEAMGLLSGALTLGAALGAPVVGTVVDHFGPNGGFAAAGLGGVLVALVLTPFGRRTVDRTKPIDVAGSVRSPA
jgi:predicted MFS family arabinose efflux permease